MYKISEIAGETILLDNTDSCTAAYRLQVWCQKMGKKAKNGKNPVVKGLSSGICAMSKGGKPGEPVRVLYVQESYFPFLVAFGTAVSCSFNFSRSWTSCFTSWANWASSSLDA